MRRIGKIGRLMLTAGLLAPLAGCNLPWFAHKTLVADPAQAYMDARHTLLEAAEDRDAQVRTKALEALARTEAEGIGGLMVQMLREPNPPVQFAAAMAIGDTRYAPAKGLLTAMARDPKISPKLLAAVVYALHRLGDDSYTSELARMIQHPDMWVRATAAMVMGRMRQPSAIGPLKMLQSDETELVVRLQAAEALAMLGDGKSITMLEAWTKDQYIEDRVIAVQALGQIEDPRVVPVLRRVMRDNHQESLVRIAAAMGLAQQHQSVSRDFVLAAIRHPEGILRRSRGKDAEIRPADIDNLQTLAVLTLGHMNDPLAVDDLMPLLRSPSGALRVAAAQSTLMLLRDYRGAAALRPAPEPAAARPAAEPATAPAFRPAAPTASQPPAATTRPATTRPAVAAPLAPDRQVPVSRPATAPPATATTATATTRPKLKPKTQPKVEPKVEPKTQPKAEPKTQPATSPPAEEPGDIKPTYRPPSPALRSSGARE